MTRFSSFLSRLSSAAVEFCFFLGVATRAIWDLPKSFHHRDTEFAEFRWFLIKNSFSALSAPPRGALSEFSPLLPSVGSLFDRELECQPHKNGEQRARQYHVLTDLNEPAELSRKSTARTFARPNRSMRAVTFRLPRIVIGKKKVTRARVSLGGEKKGIRRPDCPGVDKISPESLPARLRLVRSDLTEPIDLTIMVTLGELK